MKVIAAIISFGGSAIVAAAATPFAAYFLSPREVETISPSTNAIEITVKQGGASANIAVFVVFVGVFGMVGSLGLLFVLKLTELPEGIEEDFPISPASLRSQSIAPTHPPKVSPQPVIREKCDEYDEIHDEEETSLPVSVAPPPVLFSEETSEEPPLLQKEQVFSPSSIIPADPLAIHLESLKTPKCKATAKDREILDELCSNYYKVINLGGLGAGKTTPMEKWAEEKLKNPLNTVYWVSEYAKYREYEGIPVYGRGDSLPSEERDRLVKENPAELERICFEEINTILKTVYEEYLKRKAKARSGAWSKKAERTICLFLDELDKWEKHVDQEILRNFFAMCASGLRQYEICVFLSAHQLTKAHLGGEALKGYYHNFIGDAAILKRWSEPNDGSSPIQSTERTVPSLKARVKRPDLDKSEIEINIPVDYYAHRETYRDTEGNEVKFVSFLKTLQQYRPQEYRKWLQEHEDQKPTPQEKLTGLIGEDTDNVPQRRRPAREVVRELFPDRATAQLMDNF